MRVAITILLCFMLSLSLAHASASDAFVSDDDFNRWSTYYYQNPEPQKIFKAIKYYADSGLMSNQSNAWIASNFFAAALTQAPEYLGEVMQGFSSPTEKESWLLFNILWLMDSKESKESLLGMIDRSTDPLVRKRRNLVSESREHRYDPMDDPVTEAYQIDMLWSMFFATGDGRIIRRIINLLPLLEEHGNIPLLMVGGAAKWSLTSNALQHDEVYEICVKQVKRSKGEVKRLLNQIIEEVNLRNNKVPQKEK